MSLPPLGEGLPSEPPERPRSTPISGVPSPPPPSTSPRPGPFHQPQPYPAEPQSGPVGPPPPPFSQPQNQPNFLAPPPPGYMPPPGYAQFGTQNPQTPRNNGLCIASMVLGIVGIVICCLGILSALAIIFGFVGRNQVKNSGGTQSGQGMAMVGIILGIVGIGIFIAVIASGGGSYRIGPR